MDPVRQVWQQAPEHVTLEGASTALQQADGDIVRALELLWNIETPQEKELSEWEKRRKIIDEVYIERAKLLKDSRFQEGIRKT